MEGSISPVLEKIKSTTTEPDYFEICNGQTNLEALSEDEVWNVLMICAKECEEEVMEKFMEVNLLNKCINRRDKNGECALIVICKLGWLSLLEKITTIDTVDANLTDNEGNSPLIHAAQAGHIDIVEFLLKHCDNINIDHRNVAGFTALMKASVQGQIDCVRILILHGADHSLCDPARGMCAQGWAQYCNRHDTAEEVASFNRINAVTYPVVNDKQRRVGAQYEEGNCIRLRPSKLLSILRRTVSITMCGCSRIQDDQSSSFRKKHPIDQHDYMKDVAQRVHHNCHVEKGMTHPECLNKTIRRTGSMIRPFNNYTSPKRNSQLIIPRVEITKTNNTNNYDSFD